MFCWKCGKEVQEDQLFCGSCGAVLKEAPQAPPPVQTPPSAQASPSAQTPPPAQIPSPVQESRSNAGAPQAAPVPRAQSGAQPNGPTILKVFALVCAVVYGLSTVIALLRWVGNAFSILRYFDFYLPNLILGIALPFLAILAGVSITLILALIALKRTPQNSDGLLVLLGAGEAVLLADRLLQTLLIGVFYHHFTLKAFGLSLLGCLITLGGIFAILYCLMKERPLTGKNANQLIADAQAVLSSFPELFDGLKTQKSGQAAQGTTAAQAGPAAQTADRSGAAAQQFTPPDPSGMPPAQFRLKTDRSLLMYILLTLVTCGIYGWYFIYALARDVNAACAGDGRNTAGLIKLILLNFITCGIYSWIWYYSLGNRLAFNAPRYGMNFQENGTTILLWMILGSFLCGIGPFIALHIIIKNTNMLCGAYNHAHGM